MLADLFDLVAPQRCVCCGGEGIWCEKCRDQLTRGRWLYREVTPLVTPAAASATMMRAISQWKDAQHRALTPVFAEILLGELVAEFGSQRMNLVVIPGRKRSVRRRGYQPMLDLAVSVSRKSASRYRVISHGLAWQSEPAEQRQLDDAGRDANVAGRLVVGELPFGPLIVVDDVVTSGATLREATRVLTDAGRRPLGMATLAVSRHNLGQDFVKSVAKPSQRI